VWVAAVVAVLYEGDRLPRGLLATLLVSAISLAWARPLSMLWLAVITVVTLCAFGERDRLRARLARRPERAVVITVFVVTLASTAWTILADALGQNSGYEPRGLDLVAATRHSLALTGSYLRQMVAVFGWQREPSPVWLGLLWGGAVVLLVVLAIRPRAVAGLGALAEGAGGRRARVTLAVLVPFVVVMPTLLQVPSAERIGFVWSGRYGLPVAVGIPIVAAVIVGTRGISGRGLRALAAGLVTVAAFGQVVAHWANMRRYVVGMHGPVVYFGHAGWTPPLGKPALLAAVAASSVFLAWLAYGLATRTPATADPAPAAVARV
jgi:hypothetical protein